MNIVNFLNKKENKDIEYIRKYVFKNKIKTVIENNQDINKRVIFILNKYSSDRLNPITDECNGLLTNYNEKTQKWNILVNPIPSFNIQKLNLKTIKDLYNEGKYDVYKAYDGTVINLYYYNKKWCISTSKGYDVTNLIFVNNETYKQVLDKILIKYKEFSYDNLNKQKCYSLCLKYLDYHSFIEDQLVKENNNFIILLQSTNIHELNINKKLIINYEEQIGLPLQEKIDKNITIQQLYNNANSSYNKYQSNLKYNNIYFKPLFGYILKSNDVKYTKEYSNILIESNLMSNIRNFLYNQKAYNDFIKNNKQNRYDKLNFNKLYTFLNRKKSKLFQILFPQFKDDYYHFDLLICKILPNFIIQNKLILENNLNNIHNILNNTYTIETIIDNNCINYILYNLKNKDINFNQYNINIEQKNIIINKLNKLAILLYLKIKKINIDITVYNGESIINDIIINQKYIGYYYDYLYL